MIPNKPFRPTSVIARGKLLEAATKLIRTNGYSATSVDQLCGEAVVNKGHSSFTTCPIRSRGCWAEDVSKGTQTDSRMDMDKNPTPFDGKRMIWGSFMSIVVVKG